eukprot:623566-Rhodomonas_salina.1
MYSPTACKEERCEEEETGVRGEVCACVLRRGVWCAEPSSPSPSSRLTPSAHLSTAPFSAASLLPLLAPRTSHPTPRGPAIAAPRSSPLLSHALSLPFSPPASSVASCWAEATLASS